MQNLPKVGQIYQSTVTPTFRIYVETVDVIEADGDEPAGFCVEGCDPKDKGNDSGNGFEIFSDEWIEDGYHLIPR